MGRAPTTQEVNNRSELPVGKSLAEIAALMAENRAKMREGKPDTTSQRAAHRRVMREQRPDPQLGNDDEPDTTEGDDDPNADDGPLDLLQRGVDTGNDGADGGEGPDGDDAAPDPDDDDLPSEDDEPDDEGEEEELGDDSPFDIEDDDLFDIEGLDEPVTFRTLKDAFLADKTITTKLDEAAASHQQAAQAYAAAQTDAQKMHTAMEALMEHVVGLAAIPLVRKPDPALKTSDPARYIQQQELWQQDQQRIQNAQNTVMEALQAHETAQGELLAQNKQHMMGMLIEAVPQLKDPKKKAAASKDIIDAAAYYGFSPDEVNAAYDYRIFQMAHDAQQYRKLLAGSKTEGERAAAHKETLKARPKIMRSKGTSAKQVATAADKDVKRFRAKAKQSGKPQDVTAFMQAQRERRMRARP